jgi:GLEYA domain
MSGTSVSIGSSGALETVCQLAYPISNPVIRYYDGAGGGTLTTIATATSPFTGATLLVNGLVTTTTGNRADNYSARSRGYIRPTVSGLYTIWISSDDAGFFSLGAANGSTSGLAVNISNAGYSGGQGASGSSYTITLVAGQAYPYEMGFSEAGGGDYIQIDWSVGGSARAVVPAAVIFAENPNSLAKRQLTKLTVGGIISYTDLNGAIVVPTNEQPIVDCATDYTFSALSIGTATPATPLATTVPLADGVVDAQRTGAIGTSTNAARADHIHPITKLAPIALPNVVVGGGTFQAQSIWRQSTTEETQEFAIHVDMTATAAGQWRTITFPNIAGYTLARADIAGLYCPSLLATNPWMGQHFLWGVTTFYWSPPAAFVNQQCYWNFNLTYVLN